MMSYSASILHLSDLHFGEKNRFMKEDIDPGSLGRMCALSVLEECTNDHLPKIDIVVVTGDIAEKALEKEYAYALAFFNALKEHLSLGTDRFVFLPGNHDVSWGECARIREQLKNSKTAAGDIDNELQRVKFLTFCTEFIEKFYGKKWNELPGCLPLHAHIYDFNDFHISIAALNTCEKEDNLKQIGCFGEIQANEILKYWENEKYQQFIKIIALHHNTNVAPETLIDEELEKLGDGADEKTIRNIGGIEGKHRIEQIIKQRAVHLLFYGHQHTPHDPQPFPWERQGQGQCEVFTVGSFGLTREVIGEQPNCMAIYSIGATGNVWPQIRSISLEYDANATLDASTEPGCFRNRESMPFSKNLYFNFNELETEDPGDSRDPDILKTAYRVIKNILADNEKLFLRLCDTFETNHIENVCNVLIQKGLDKTWYEMTGLLDRRDISINSIKGILFWLATAEAHKKEMSIVRDALNQRTDKFTHWLNARFPVVVEIIVAAWVKRPVYVKAIEIWDTVGNVKKTVLVGEDLIYDPRSGFILSNKEEYLMSLLLNKFAIGKDAAGRYRKDLEESLGVAALSRRPVYVITDKLSQPLSIKNLLEFKLEQAEDGVAPTAKSERIILSVLEQILRRISEEKK
jgi:predicted MPP superfamily phosphohydrolase